MFLFFTQRVIDFSDYPNLSRRRFKDGFWSVETFHTIDVLLFGVVTFVEQKNEEVTTTVPMDLEPKIEKCDDESSANLVRSLINSSCH